MRIRPRCRNGQDSAAKSAQVQKLMNLPGADEMAISPHSGHMPQSLPMAPRYVCAPSHQWDRASVGLRSPQVGPRLAK
jgi:hypothetical protein